VIPGLVEALTAARVPGVPGPDTWLHQFALAHRGGAVVGLARAVTSGGSTLVVWPMVAAAALIYPRRADGRRRRTALIFAAATAPAIGVRLALSDVLRRARPPQTDWAGAAGGFAFPSGHTTAATIGAGALAWAITRHLAGRRARGAVWAGAVVWAATVGWSRVWLGVHWPSDVVGGWLLGTAWLAGMAAAADVVRSRLRAPSCGRAPVTAGGSPPAR
jgi:undecaprenyl-diphosphatase